MAGNGGGPYRALMDKITVQAGTLVQWKGLPVWLSQILSFQTLRVQEKAYQKGFVKTMTESVSKTAMSVEKATGHDAGVQTLEIRKKQPRLMQTIKMH